MKPGISSGFIACLFLAFLSFIACKKEPPEPPDSPDSTGTTTPIHVQAGIFDSSFFYQEFTPAFEAAISWDSVNLYGVGIDSLDLDGDATHDLIVELYVLNEDSLHLLNGLPNPFPYCRLRSTIPYRTEIATYTHSYPIGLGQTAEAFFAEPMEHGEYVDSIVDWRLSINMWAENPSGTVPYGNFYHANGIRYIGIRRDSTKLGWLEVDITDPHRPVFNSSAVQN